MTKKERMLVVLISLGITFLVLLGIWSLQETEVTAIQDIPVIDENPPGPVVIPPTIPPSPKGNGQAEKPVLGGEIDTSVETSGGSIEGKVVDGRGRPVLSAVVTALQKNNTRKYVFTDEDGKYIIKDLPAGSYDIRADREKYAIAVKRGIKVERDLTTPNVNFELVLGGSFTGFVLSGTGDEPVSGANITIYLSGFNNPDYNYERSFRAKTGKDGAFLVENIPPGEYFAHAQHKSYLSSERVPVRIESDKEAAHKFIIELGGSVSGAITDFEDNPVEDAQVWLSTADRTLHLGRGAKTNSDGVYMLEGLKAGTVNIRVIAQGFVTMTKKDINVSIGQHTEGVDFKLDRGKGVSGVVVDYAGEPVKNATVSASDSISYKTAKTDKNGAFELTGFSGETVNLSIRAQGYVFFVKRNIPAGTENLSLVLGKGGTIEGQVIADELLVDFVVILTIPPEKQGGRSKIVKQKVSRDPQGRFKMVDIPRGTYTVTANGRALEDNTRKYVQASGEIVEVREGTTTSGLQIHLVQK